MDEMKNGLIEAELQQIFIPEVMYYTIFSLVAERIWSNEWASKQEVKKMVDLLDLPIISI